jgi:hypothetical protein
MMLFYIDESGTGLRDPNSPYFVLSATAVHATDWKVIDAGVAALKRRLVSWAKPEDFEIKGRDLRRGEKFFKNQSWEWRMNAFLDSAKLLAELPCQVLTVQVDTRDLPEYVRSDTDLYRLAFWRLLEEIDSSLDRERQPGMLMVDMRSDMHSSVQDRRLIDAYRDWIGSRMGLTRLVELPWFGFSAFYAGLQLADFTAYLVDFVSTEIKRDERNRPLLDAYSLIQSKVTLIRIPGP